MGPQQDRQQAPPPPHARAEDVPVGPEEGLKEGFKDGRIVGNSVGGGGGASFRDRRKTIVSVPTTNARKKNAMHTIRKEWS
jgi:hypothetical protein